MEGLSAGIEVTAMSERVKSERRATKFGGTALGGPVNSEE